ncbi:MAG: AzlC family ABC transporter permease [Mogibacterium sp.]|nr:AzlC family ABC transporter permease [Mogibacterium sp.]
MKAGLPIGAGYFAVSFTLGIAARKIGLTSVQGLLTSLVCNASAGQYAAYASMGVKATCLELALVLFVANARYLLMSGAMSQRLDPEIPLLHRLLIAYDITDELFGIAVAQPGYLNPYYSYGAVLTAAPCWAAGTAVGVLAGSILPLRIASALGVALYGMFLACIIPDTTRNNVVSGVILISFAASWSASVLPGISALSSGTRTILLTLLICGGAAYFFPHVETAAGEETSRESAPAASDRRRVRPAAQFLRPVFAGASGMSRMHGMYSLGRQFRSVR